MFNLKWKQLAPHGGFPKQRIESFGERLSPIISDVSRVVGEEYDYNMGAYGPKSRFERGIAKGALRRYSPGEIHKNRLEEKLSKKHWKAEDEDVRKVRKQIRIMKERGMEIGPELKEALRREIEQTKRAKIRWDRSRVS